MTVFWKATMLASILLTTPLPLTAMEGEEMGEFEAERQARKAHELASSDVIYQQEEWKALYYQNIQIIKLLREIRDSMQSLNERAAKAEQKS